MHHYECIFRSFADQTPACCWLRLYQRPEEIVVLLADVAGNPGPPVLVGVNHLATQLVTRFKLNPARLLWVEYHPPDTLSTPRDAYRHLSLTWMRRDQGQGRQTTCYAASWQEITRQQVEGLIGSRLPRHPFWRDDRPGDHLRQWVVRVAGRTGQVWHTTDDEARVWRALVQGRRDELTHSTGATYPTRLAAQRWVLHRLAGLALEFDTLPTWAAIR